MVKNKLTTIKEFEDALWEFILEHCDVLDSGSLFVKFHISGKTNLLNRVRARHLYEYHREDVVAKENIQTEKKEKFLDLKMTKKQRDKMNTLRQSEYRRKQKIIGRINNLPKFLQKPIAKIYGL